MPRTTRTKPRTRRKRSGYRIAVWHACCSSLDACLPGYVSRVHPNALGNTIRGGTDALFVIPLGDEWVGDFLNVPE